MAYQAMVADYSKYNEDEKVQNINSHHFFTTCSIDTCASNAKKRLVQIFSPSLTLLLLNADPQWLSFVSYATSERMSILVTRVYSPFSGAHPRRHELGGENFPILSAVQPPRLMPWRLPIVIGTVGVPLNQQHQADTPKHTGATARILVRATRRSTGFEVPL